MKKNNILTTIIWLWAIGISQLATAQTIDLALNASESGNKTHQARNTITFNPGYEYTPNGGSMVTQIVDPIITGDIEYASAINPGSYAINTGLPVGKTPGGLNISGEANYSIPIDIPKGTANLQPHISINYTNSYNDGLLGIGFNIGGLSTIYRTNQETYMGGRTKVYGSISDKYALDGKRLKLVSGTQGADNSTYGTELEEFSKVIAYGSTGSNQGPQYLKAYTKNGLIYEYGNTNDSKVKNDGTAILKWKVNKISDRNGNYISFKYLESDDEHPIYEIEYTGNSTLSKLPFAKIHFKYNRREDRSSYCYGKTEFQRELLLEQIHIEYNSQTYKKYNLSYTDDTYSQLIKVEEEGKNGTKLNPTIFTWSSHTQTSTNNTHYSGSRDCHFYHGDFNGDGRMDFVTVPIKTSYSTSDKWKLYQANSTGSMIYITEGYLVSGFTGFIPADYNGDGLCDLMRITNNSCFKYWQSNGITFNTSGVGYCGYGNLQPIDYNGDGKLEIFTFRQESDHIDYKVYSYTGSCLINSDNLWNAEISSLGDFAPENPANGHVRINDFNGDGKTDILALFDDEYKLYEFSSQKLYCTQSGTNLTNYDACIFGDFNGDGTTDIIKTIQATQGPWSLIYFVKDKFEEKSISGFADYDLSATTNRWQSSDFNGDGKMDFIIWGKGTDTNNSRRQLHVALNNGNGYEFSVTENNTSFTMDLSANDRTENYFEDYNGDGCPEMFYINHDISKHYSFSSGGPGHLITNIIDGFGAKTEITYTPMSNSSIYTRSAGASYPLADIGSSMQLVSEVKVDDGIGCTASITYKYKGAKKHVGANCFVGFSEITETNEETKISSTSTFTFHSSKYFPKLYQVVTKYNGSTNLSTNTNIWSEKSLIGDRIFPYVSSLTNTDNIKNLYVQTTSQYDNYGNPTSIVKNFGGAHTQSTTFAYNDEKVSTWLIGRPTTITETWQKGSETNTSITTRTYFSGNNLPDIDQYNSGTLEHWQLNRDYDSFGNLWKVHKGTTGLSEQTTTYKYDDNHGTNLEKVTSPMGNYIDYTYETGSGEIKTQTDHLGNVVTFNYNNMHALSSTVPINGISNTISTSFSTTGGPSFTRFYIQETGSDGSVEKKWYDKLGRELRSETKGFNGILVKVDMQYNSKRQMYRISEPSTSTPALWNTTAFDNYGRINSLDPYFGVTTTFSYDEAQTTQSVNSRNYTSTINDAGLTTERTDPGGTITYNYFPNGTLKSTVAVGVTTSMTYDKNGNRLTITDASAGTISNEYYGTGQLKSTETARSNSESIYHYQTNGLLDYIDTPESEHINYSYNSNNQVSSITSPGGVSRSFTYYTNGRPHTVTETVGTESNTVTFEYDSKGRIFKKYFNATDYEQCDYNSYGYLYRVKFNGSTVWQQTGMDEYGKITAATIGTTSATWSYDSNEMLEEIKAIGVQEYDYSFDISKGNLNWRKNVIRDKTDNFYYHTSLDNLQSSISFIQSGQPPQVVATSYTSNNNGNIQSKSDAGAYEYNLSGKPYQVSAITNPVDVNPELQEIDYNWFDKVSHISQGTKTADFTYNADKQRIKMVLKTNGSTTKTRYYFGGQVERDVVGSTKTDYYWIGGDAYTAVGVAKKVGTTTTVYNIFRDHVGTITHLKSSSGTNEYSFDAWGRRRDKDSWLRPVSADEPDLFANRGFTAHEHLEDFDLINMNGRLYDPVVGRFLSADPQVQSPGFTQSYNRYSYCLNNPLKFTDPSGEIFGWIGAMVGNYVINGMNNWVNQGMSFGQAFSPQYNPVVLGGSYSPSSNTLFNNQVNAQNMPGIMAAGQQGIANNLAGLQDWSSWEPTGIGDVLNQSFVGGSPLDGGVALVGRNTGAIIQQASTASSVVYQGGIKLRTIFEGIYRNEAAYNYRNNPQALKNMFINSNKVLNRISTYGKWGGKSFLYLNVGVESVQGMSSIFSGQYQDAASNGANIGAALYCAPFGLVGIPMYGLYRITAAPAPITTPYTHPNIYLQDNTYVAPVNPYY